MVEWLTEIAKQRSLTLEEALGQAIDQSCERWRLEKEFGPTEVAHPALDIPRKKGALVEVKSGPPRQLSPILLDVCESIPVELPRSPSTPIKVTKTVKRWPERLHDDT